MLIPAINILGVRKDDWEVVTKFYLFVFIESNDFRTSFNFSSSVLCDDSSFEGIENLFRVILNHRSILICLSSQKFKQLMIRN